MIDKSDHNEITSKEVTQEIKVIHYLHILEPSRTRDGFRNWLAYLD